MMGKNNEERLMEMYEESEAEKRILCEKIDRTVAELTATRKKAGDHCGDPGRAGGKIRRREGRRKEHHRQDDGLREKG